MHPRDVPEHGGGSLLSVRKKKQRDTNFGDPLPGKGSEELHDCLALKFLFYPSHSLHAQVQHPAQALQPKNDMKHLELDGSRFTLTEGKISAGILGQEAQEELKGRL